MKFKTDLKSIKIYFSFSKKNNRKRLDEGFHVAHNSGNGIVNVALEMKMSGECDIDCPNIVQYVIFPPYNKALVLFF